MGEGGCLEVGLKISFKPLKSGWVVCGPENSYNFPYPRLLRKGERKAGKTAEVVHGRPGNFEMYGGIS